ncbi:MAG: cation-efflux pump [Firmicutes bacterium HGW-Firmicutes-21]|nr:MAG: cation-efflux pump [Firmicutes bacterium HGW-Firmicutes-21]
MVYILAKIFIKDHSDEASIRQRYGILCGILGIFLNLFLFLGKLFVGIISGSIAATADAFNNLSDAGSSVVTAVGFKLAGQKPDIHHPYGHGRIEYISGLIVSLIIILVGVELLKSSVEKIINPAEVKLSFISLAILTASVCVKLYMAFYNSRIGKKIQSSAMKAVSKDSLCDCVATTAVLLSMIIMDATGFNTDGWSGLLVALLIIYTGINSVRETVSPLLGQPPEPKLVQEIEQIVLSFPDIVGLHDLIVHDYGPGRRMISLHAEVPEDSDILAMHDIVDNAEKELRVKIGCQAVIHMDPISVKDERTLTTKKVVEELVKSIDKRITLHDFRMVTGRTHTNVIFDMVVPFDIKKSECALKEEAASLINEFDRTLYAVVDIDRENA